MTLPSGLRKGILSSHVISSVGWLGAVASFLVLAIAGLVSGELQLVRASYTVMRVLGWWIIVPACVASVVTGLVLSAGTQWGLVRHYWVLIKVLMSIPATVLLFVHMQPISYISGVAATKALSSTDLHGLRVQLLIQTSAALVVLLVATVLSVYKPRGTTPFGRAQTG